MNSNEYLETSGTFENNKYYEIRDRLTDDNIRVLHACFGMAGETGELVDAFKKHLLYGKPLDKEHLKEEAGDILWYMAVMLRTIGTSFEEVMQINNDKLSKRYPVGYTNEHAQLRLDKENGK